MTDEKTIRSFLALDTPEKIREGIGAVQSRLKKIIHGDIRWARPEGIHLTLKFFGNISEDDVVNISAVVEKIAAGSLPLVLTIGGTGAFPDPHRPRVVYLGMNGDVERLIAFQKELERALETIGFPREERPFLPHLTLGRIKSPGGLIGLAGVVEKGESYTAGEFSASGLGLFKSDLTPRGAVYTRLAWYPFAGQGSA
ncbi:MAG: 2'-5' RNA ligase [Deltaproteobacteria bacterium RBG_16_58_17]|nr:MAG: 2'-5' RNA ligase [Deltaproteobacteria bacterium RBG_16_58_17]OHE18308.1 MAG: 2'-5' RNA ligase [Syntrophobacterales bacterium GWC2_56_13]